MTQYDRWALKMFGRIGRDQARVGATDEQDVDGLRRL